MIQSFFDRLANALGRRKERGELTPRNLLVYETAQVSYWRGPIRFIAHARNSYRRNNSL